MSAYKGKSSVCKSKHKNPFLLATCFMLYMAFKGLKTVIYSKGRKKKKKKMETCGIS
jgi:hypothetical protein